MNEALILRDHLEAGMAKFTAVAAWFPFQYNVSMYVAVEMDLHYGGNRGTRVYSHDKTLETNIFFSE